MLNITAFSVLKIICLMIKYKGSVYLVTCNDVNYVVKNYHLEEFVALKSSDGVIVITGFVMSQIDFDNAFQWYKKI